MKVLKKKNKSLNLIDKILINSRTYLNKNKSLTGNLNLKILNGLRSKFLIFNVIKIKLFIKKNFKLIYEFNKKGKKILFFGFPKKITPKIAKTMEISNSCFMPLKIKYLNILLNKSQIIKNLYNQIICADSYKSKYEYIKKLNEVNKLKENTDLIVVYNKNYFYNNYNLNFFKKLSSSNLPTVILNDNIENISKEINILYQTPIIANQRNKLYNNFCYYEILHLLKKINIKKFK